MENRIVVEIEYTDRDVRHALFEIINGTNKLWVASVCELVVIGLVLFFGIRNGFGRYYAGLVLVLLVVYLLFLVTFYIYPINRYVDVYRLQRKTVFVFSEESFTVQRTDIQSLCSWSLIINAVVLSKYIVLRDNHKALTILPKRCFISESDVEELISILKRKVKVLE